MTNQDDYLPQSTVTDPGQWATWIDEIPANIAAIRQVSRQLVFHYRANGDLGQYGIPPERLTDIDLRYASSMFDRIHTLHDAPLATDRPPTARMIGCCRDHTVFFVAIARHKGIPARMRVGFATYFIPGWNLDHVVAEVWDSKLDRWRLVEAEIEDGYVDPGDDTTLDVLDIPRDRFVVAPQAWLACRTGDADPETFVVAPDLTIPLTRSWPYLAHNLLHDLAALNCQEMILWDTWGLADRFDPLNEIERLSLDDTSRLLLDEHVTSEQLALLLDRDGFRVPPVVTSYSSISDLPLQVTLR